MDRLETLTGSDRVYRIKRSMRVNAVLFLLMAPLVGPIFQHGELSQIGTSAILFCFGTYLVVYTFGTKITLSTEAIELRTLCGRKRLRFDEIQGRRECSVYGKYGYRRKWKLEPNDSHLPGLTFEKDFDFDGVFQEWLNKLPNLEATDNRESADLGFK